MKNYITYTRIKIMFYGLLALVIISAPTLHFLKFISDYFIHLVGIFFAIGLVGFFLNNRPTLILGFGLCTIICLQLKNESEVIFKDKAYENSKKLQILVINLSDSNDPQSLFKLIYEKDPDVVSFLEVTPDWAQVAPQFLSSKYPHNIIKSSADVFGKAVFSKFKILNTRHEDKEIFVTIQFEKEAINVVPVYITPSLDNISKTTSKAQLDLITTFVSTSSFPSIVLGQFNNVYWSQEIKSFKTMADLKNCRNASLPLATEVQKEISFHTASFVCHEIKDFRTRDGNKIGLFTSYLLKIKKAKI